MDQPVFTIEDVADELESVQECLGFGDQLKADEFHLRARRGIRRARLMAQALVEQAGAGDVDLPISAGEREDLTATTAIKLLPMIPPNPNAFPS